MKKRPSQYIPDYREVEVSRWIGQLQEAQRRLRELLGDEVETVLGSEGQTFLLLEAQEKLLKSEARARRNEEMLKEAQRIARLGCWELDLTNLKDINANALYWSDEVFFILGMKPGQIAPDIQTFLGMVHPEDRIAVQEAARRAIQNGEGYEIKHRIIRPDGSIRFLREEIHIFKHPETGRLLRMIGVGQDITDRMEKDNELRLSEKRFSNAFEYASVGMAMVSTEGRWLRVNRALCALIGYSAEELLGKTFQDITHPDDLANDLEEVRRMLARETDHYKMEKRYFHKQGQIVWIMLSVSLLWDDQGKPLYFISQIQDITERKVNEQKMAEQAALIDEARDAIVVWNLEHRVLFCNRSAERLYGWSMAEMVDRPITDFVSGTTGRFNAATQTVLAKGEWSGEIEQTNKNGAALVVESRWTLLREPNRKPRAILCINTDITDRKKLESHLLRAQRIESIGTLASGIAHDLNNLLAPIIMGVDLLKHFGLEGPNLSVVEDIERSAKRGSALVKQLLSFARGEEGKRVAVNLREIVGEIESIVHNTFPKDIRIVTKLAACPMIIDGDPIQLNQILLNLCVNSRDAMPKGGEISIAADIITIEAHDEGMQSGIVGGRYICIEVADIGCGIAPENVPKIFDPFFTTKELAKGTGLGLATTLGIVRSHGGFIHVESEQGRGTLFKIYLPVRAEVDEAPMESAGPGDCPTGNGEWILLVDDEAPILAVTRQTLEMFGYHVLTAENGARAIGVFAAHRDKIALVLTDMMMPVMDGMAMIFALREIDPAIRIIAASGLNSQGNTARALASGVTHALVKPYSTSILLTTLRAVLQEKSPSWPEKDGRAPQP